jgi:antirestriction protein ArdC
MQTEKKDLYERVTTQIIEAIEKGAAEYRMRWHVGDAECFAPVNVVSGRAYRGINVLVLWALAERQRYASGLWGTFNQWQSLGARVRKGEKAALIVYWRISEKSSESESGDAIEAEVGKRRVFGKGYSVFNLAQVEGYTPEPRATLSESERLADAEESFRLIGATVKHGGSVAAYDRIADVILMPEFQQFREAAGYYSVLAHEVTHWTGAEHRLKRDLSHRFGSDGYAMEELVAELGAAFLCSMFGISNVPREEHAGYLSNWLAVLHRDKRALFTAASHAQQAADWIAERRGQSMAA